MWTNQLHMNPWRSHIPSARICTPLFVGGENKRGGGGGTVLVRVQGHRWPPRARDLGCRAVECGQSKRQRDLAQIKGAAVCGAPVRAARRTAADRFERCGVGDRAGASMDVCCKRHGGVASSAPRAMAMGELAWGWSQVDVRTCREGKLAGG